jgi:hypothetical protein
MQGIGFHGDHETCAAHLGGEHSLAMAARSIVRLQRRLDFSVDPQVRNANPILQLALFNGDSWYRQAPGAFVFKPIEISANRVEIFDNALRPLHRVRSNPLTQSSDRPFGCGGKRRELLHSWAPIRGTMAAC